MPASGKSGTRRVVRRLPSTTTKKKKHMTHAERVARDVKKQERQALIAQVVDLRTGGATYTQIASTLHLSGPSRAKQLFDEGISQVVVDAAKETVALDLQRIDEYMMRCTHALRTNGDLRQIDRLIMLMNQKYRLMGVTDETVRSIQADHGISTTHVSTKNQVMVVQASPETEDEFIRKMMGAVGVDPDSSVARTYVEGFREREQERNLPLLAGSANDAENVSSTAAHLGEEDIVDAEIVD